MGKVSITPDNWESGGKETLSEQWVIRYRYYHHDGQVKNVWISDFNHGFDTLTERRKQLRDALAFEINRLENNGWNPILKEYAIPINRVAAADEVSKFMTFVDALTFADTKIKVSAETRKQETDCLLKQIISEAKKQGIAGKQMHEVTRKNLKEIIEKCSINKFTKKHSADKYNRLRKVLCYYYKELLDYEVTDSIIPASLNKEKQATKKVAAEISPEMQKKVSQYLKDHFYPFYLYLQVFYNSTPRSTEMMRLQVKDVDLKNQRIKFLIKKGNRYTEKYRVIPDIAVKWWRQILGNAPNDWYVFGKGLQPSETPIKAYQINKRWYRLISQNEAFKGVGITFYQLKHLRLTDVADSIGIDEAAKLGAENEKTVAKHYDMNKGRGDSKLRESGKEW